MSRLIRTLTLPEVETLVGWAAAEGWNPGTADAAAFHAADPHGFLGAFVDGEFAAGISAVAYAEDFGFIGLYICRPQFRGLGHGKAVWDAGMARLAGRTIGLDGVPEQQANYTRMGFVRANETIRMTGRPTLAPSGRRVATNVDFAHLRDFDRHCFPAAREAFLQQWIAPPRILGAIATDDGLAGYGVIRPCVAGHKVGPLFAQSMAVAVDLLAALLGDIGGQVQIDVPVHQAALLDLLGAAGMTPGFSTARMYRGPAPRIYEHQVFGITTLELG